MNFLAFRQTAMDFESVCVVFWILVTIFEFSFKRSAPRLLRIIFWLPGRMIRLFVLILGIGFLLSGCANSDPLAVASGPLYQLNTRQWHATSQELSAPPSVVHN